MITDEELRTVLYAGSIAPTGMNRQPVVAIAVKDKALRNKLSSMNAAVMGASSDPFYGAPVVISVLCDSNASTYLEDGSLAIGNMLTAAESLGLGACWIHRAKEMFMSKDGKELLREWGLDDSYVGIGNVILGYRDKEPMPPKAIKSDFARII